MFRSIVVVACLACSLVASGDAAAQFRGGFRGNSLSFSFGYGGIRPYRNFYYSTPYPYYYGGYGYDYGYANPHGIYYNPGAGYLDYYLPPVYAPAELAYGPQAMQRFIGPPPVDPFGGVPGGLDRVAAKAIHERPVDAKPEVRASNLEARRLALRLTALGDNLFREQRYHEALQKYKSAAETAPDMAEPYFRQGHALTATFRYDLAAAAFKKGVALGPLWADSDFRLSSIYGLARMVKEQHVEHLARAVLDKPEDANLTFVLALFLHFDGDEARATRLFNRVADLTGKDAPHVRPFLREEKADARQENAQPPAEPPGVDA